MTRRAIRSTATSTTRVPTSRELSSRNWLREDEDTLGAGDQGVMVGYACNETPGISAHACGGGAAPVTLLEISRMTGVIPDIGPDGKVQVTMEYNGDTPVRITTVVVSVHQHKEDTDINKLADLLDEYVFPLAFDGMPADDAEIIPEPQRQSLCRAVRMPIPA